VADLQAASDLFALSSVREGLPVVVLEAMRAGRPVVATDVGGTAEAVEDGRTGLVVPPSDVTALTGALSALAGDPDRRRTMGEAGRRRWAERFTAERMVRATEGIYRALLSPARPQAGAAEGGGRP
jgi:glycosyltransferase involved in cell wall biosynthesis